MEPARSSRLLSATPKTLEAVAKDFTWDENVDGAGAELAGRVKNLTLVPPSAASTIASPVKLTGEMQEVKKQVEAMVKMPPLDPIIEMKTYADKLAGKWVTVMDKSDPLEALLAKMKVSWMKRKVMAGYAVPLDCHYGKDPSSKNVLYIVAYMPMGVVKTMEWRLDGRKYIVEDSDAGSWDSYCTIGEYEKGRELQLIRSNKLGKVIETRRIVKDAQYGDMMHICYRMIPTDEPKEIVCNRYLKKN